MQTVKKLGLVDFGDDESTHESRVGILIVVFYYFHFLFGKTLQKLEGLVTSLTILGWVLSRPITWGDSSFASVYHSLPVKPVLCAAMLRTFTRKQEI